MKVLRVFNKYTEQDELAIVNSNDIPIIWIEDKNIEEELKRLFDIKQNADEAIAELHEISGILIEKGKIHIADAITNCIIYILKNYTQEENIIRLDKIISLLISRGENDLAERVQVILPDILACKNIDLEEVEIEITKISALRAYNIVKRLKEKYEVGNIDDFEYDKMVELEVLLRMGFVLSKPSNYKKLPNENSWWDHFEMRIK